MARIDKQQEQVLSWLRSLTDDTPDGRPVQKRNQVETEVLTAEEVTRLLDIPKRHTLVGCRNYALLQLMVQTGIRCNEALQVMEDDIRWEDWGENGDRKMIWVLRLRTQTTKGKKPRRGLPLSNETMEAINAWKYMKGDMDLDGGPLFCTIENGERAMCKVSHGWSGGFVAGTYGERKTLVPGTQINGRYVRTMIARYGEQAGIEKRVHPHMLRHTSLTSLYNRTQNIRLVQEVAGHSSIVTTQRYTRVSPEQIADAMGIAFVEA